jgi:hypothetical protein
MSAALTYRLELADGGAAEPPTFQTTTRPRPSRASSSVFDDGAACGPLLASLDSACCQGGQRRAPKPALNLGKWASGAMRSQRLGWPENGGEKGPQRG